MQSSGDSEREYAVKLYAGAQPIWSTPRRLVASGRSYTWTVDVQWYRQTMQVVFESALFIQERGAWPAYNASLRVYSTALQANQPLDVQLDTEGALQGPAVARTARVACSQPQATGAVTAASVTLTIIRGLRSSLKCRTKRTAPMQARWR